MSGSATLEVVGSEDKAKSSSEHNRSSSEPVSAKTRKVKIMSVVGARPNFMKVGPIITAIREFNQSSPKKSSSHRPAAKVEIDHLLVHTGQHYDQSMSDQFFTDLNLPRPDIHLGVGGGSHGSQTAEVLRKFEEVVIQERPDFLIVVGDVNSTIACALAAAKLPDGPDGVRPMIVHVESGLRSFDRSMPEEHNRVLTDHLADILFVTEPSGLTNLKREGIPSRRIHFVGNTMIDTLLAFQKHAGASKILDDLGLRHALKGASVKPEMEPYALLTLHRPANVDNRDALLKILHGLEELAAKMPIIFPTHPRTAKRFEEFGLGHMLRQANLANRASGLQIEPPAPGIYAVPPSGYLDFVCLMKYSQLVVTDSGGIQEETTCLSVPCVTVRENTERPVTITSGTNVLAGVESKGIRKAIRQQLSRRLGRTSRPPKWDGKSALRIVAILAKTAGNRKIL